MAYRRGRAAVAKDPYRPIDRNEQRVDYYDREPMMWSWSPLQTVWKRLQISVLATGQNRALVHDPKHER